MKVPGQTRDFSKASVVCAIDPFGCLIVLSHARDKTRMEESGKDENAFIRPIRVLDDLGRATMAL